MNIAIMQPYFMPYIGYFQLINYVDKFVVYDNIEFTKKGWINRNRILLNSSDSYITLPIKKDSDYLFISERFLSESFDKDKNKLLNKLRASYSKAPYFNDVAPVLNQLFNYGNHNLFEYLIHSLKAILEYLSIKTEIITSSELKLDHSLKSEDKVIAINKFLNADVYINPIGGIDLYSKSNFKNNGIKLSFIKSNEIRYKQFDNEFVPWLSIIDIMMFNSKENIGLMLNEFKLV